MPIEDSGITYSYRIFNEMGYFFREQNKHDFGIDAHVETDDGQEKGTGRIIALQIKSGESNFKFNKRGDLVFYDNKKPAPGRHIRYWAESTLPVILILYSPEQKVAWWCDVKAYISRHPAILLKPPYRIEIPREHILTVDSKAEFAELAAAPTSKLSLAENYYDLLTINDVSHAGTKRYTADILVGDGNNDAIRFAIYQTTEQLKTVVEHSSSIREFHWGDQSPHVIWIFVYKSLQDKVQNNWIARALWRDLSNEGAKLIKPDNMNDYVENIEIDFASKEQYTAWRDHLLKKASTKTQFIKKVDLWTPQIDVLIQQGNSVIEKIEKQEIVETNFITEMGKLEHAFTQIEHQIDNGTVAPTECHDAEEQFVLILADAGNFFISFSARGLETWPEARKRMYFAKRYSQKYKDDREMLGFEMRKLKTH